MNAKNKIEDKYFDWIYDLVREGMPSREGSYRKLLMKLHSTEFIFSNPMDENRAEDGINLRYKFAFERNVRGIDDYLNGPCSVLEMMASLAFRIEDHIMWDPDIGDRTGQWFWGMVDSLGLTSMTDDQFDRDYVDDCLTTFLNREYSRDGEGGLFTVKNCAHDMRDTDIWYQMCYYLKTIG